MSSRALRFSALATIAALACASCEAGLSDNDGPDGCDVEVKYNPDPIVASLTQRARATARVLDFGGIAQYRWKIDHGGVAIPFTPTNPDGSTIEFPVVDAGIYHLTAEIAGCDKYDHDVNVLQANAEPRSFRIRVTPPSGSPLPAQDRGIVIPSGSDFAYGSLVVESFVQRFGEVRINRPMGIALVPAYLRLALPSGDGNAVLETVADDKGGFVASISNTPHQVLVVPRSDEYAPFVTTWDPMQASVMGNPGVTLAGTVRDPDNQPVVGARVTVKREAPSTVGVTGADGSFSLRLQTSQAPARITVVPPEGSGLPRLEGTAAQLAIGQSLDLRYRADLQRRELGGLELRRQGAVAPGAQAIFVGDVAAAGSAQGGAVTMNGAVRVAVTAGADGKLPAVRVPAAALSAVLVTAPREQAVLPFDATTTPPATLDAPAMRAVTGTVQTPARAAAPGAHITLVPTGALARAGIAGPANQSGAGGDFSIAAAAGGSYLAEISDPLRRGAPSFVAVAAPGPLGTLPLPAGHRLLGTLMPQFAASGLGGAAIELFCVQCSAEAKLRPLATAVSDADGKFELLVPDEVPVLPAP